MKEQKREKKEKRGGVKYIENPRRNMRLVFSVCVRPDLAHRWVWELCLSDSAGFVLSQHC